jgi:hypothetical protein
MRIARVTRGRWPIHLAVVAAFSCGAVATLAADLPTPWAGVAYNTKDKGWITYECHSAEGELITCDFVQVKIRLKLLPSEVEQAFQKALKAEPQLTRTDPKAVAAFFAGKEMVELCDIARTYTALSEGRAVSNKEMADGYRKMTPDQRKDAAKQLGPVVESCATSSLDGLRKLVRTGFEKDARTCLVATNPFTQVLRPVKDDAGKLLAWQVADTQPQGDCGFVQMSRFRPAEREADGGVLFWQYVGKRATSNPEGKWMLGSCQDWDESETVYDWKGDAIPLQCDAIEFSPL